MRRRFAYLHVPKVAGSAVSSAVAAAAPDARRAPHLLDRTLFGSFDRFDLVDPRNAETVWDPSREDLGASDVVVGHFSLPTLLTGFEPREIAMLLREPRARLLSHYAFWRGWDPPVHDGWAPYAASRRAAELDWHGFLRDPSIAAQTDNLAIRMLLGGDPDIPPDGFIAHDALGDLAERAVTLQKSLGHVHVIEQDGCWERLGAWLDTTLDMQRVNVTALASGAAIERAWFDGIDEALDERTRGDRMLWNAAGGTDAIADVAWRRQVDRIVTPFEQRVVVRSRRPPVEPDEVGVVILAFDSPSGVLEACVRSVVEHCPAATHIVVVDNGVDAQARLASSDDDLGAVTVIDAPGNDGYAAGMNLGMAALFADGCRVVVLLNDDVSVGPGWLPPLLDELRADDVASAQPLLVDPSDGDVPITVGSAGVQLDSAGAGTDRLMGESVESVVAASPEGADIGIFTGGAVALHRDAVASVGGFDERFFLYYEDVEFSRRLARAGWRHRLVTRSVVTHRGSATTSSFGDEVRRLQERNRLWSAAIHGSRREILGALWLSIRRLRHAPRGVHRRALLAGVAGMPVRVLARLRGRPASDSHDLIAICERPIDA